MATLGLFPEEPARPRSPLRWAFAALAVGFAGVTLFAGLEIRRLAEERDRERARSAELEKRLSAPAVGSAPPPAPSQAVLAPDPPASLPPPSSRSAPEPADASRDRREARERIERGLEELRGGRYGAAELQFFRAVPDSYLYLALSSLARGDLKEAAAFLLRAWRVEGAGLRKIRPREVLSPEEYARLLLALEERIRQDPLDVEAKTLLAYFYYHEKGPAYAKALMVEAAAARPEDPDLPKLLEELERP